MNFILRAVRNMAFALEKACRTIESEKSFRQLVEVDLQFELRHFLKGTVVEILHEIPIDFVGRLVFGGFVPVPFSHRKIAMLYEPRKRGLRVWPLTRLQRAELLGDEGFEFLFCLPSPYFAISPSRIDACFLFLFPLRGSTTYRPKLP
jgi:hypothetical protein